MTYEDLLLEKEGQIAILTLNAPEKLNALTRNMKMNLPLAADEIAKDDEVRVVIVTGAGRGFCSGADVAAMQAHIGGTTEVSRYERSQVLGWPFADVFPKLSKPVIAAINGACVGGGFSLALSCDIRIAAETARFGALQIARALVPDYGMTYLLPHAIGTSKALELMFSGKLITATEAERLGIISRVVPAEELMKVARELATEIAQQPPVAVELTKKLAYRYMIENMAHQLDLETWAQSICFQTEDHKESVRSFLDKRPRPQFKGK